MLRVFTQVVRKEEQLQILKSAASQAAPACSFQTLQTSSLSCPSTHEASEHVSPPTRSFSSTTFLIPFQGAMWQRPATASPAASLASSLAHTPSIAASCRGLASQAAPSLIKGSGKPKAQPLWSDESSVVSSPEREADGKLQKKPEAKPKGPKHQLGIAQQPRRLVTAPMSPNLIAEPYRGVPPSIPWLAYFTRKGWKERWRRFLGGTKSIYTVAKCIKNLPDFELKGFKEEANKLYSEINSAIASGDRTKLRHVVTPGELTQAKRQIKLREDGGWSRVDWSLSAPLGLQDTEIMHARLMALDPKRDDLTFAQITVKFEATHKFAAYDRNGKLKSGDPSKGFPVQDIWVLERSFIKESHSRWRLAGRIGGLPPEALRTNTWRQRFTDWFISRRK